MNTMTTNTFRFAAGQIAQPASTPAPDADGRLLGASHALEGRRIR